MLARKVAKLQVRKRKTVSDDNFFVTLGKKKNCIAGYAVRLGAQGGNAIYCKVMLTQQETF